MTVEPMSDIWDDVSPNDLHNEGGVELKKGKKPERLLQRLIDLTTSTNQDIVADVFVGSGTSVCVAQKAGRKWLGVEFGDHFETKALVRMKKVLAGDQTGVSASYRWRGGGFFKYFTLEQYEDAVAIAEYAGEPRDLFSNSKTNPYIQYVFFRDLKMARALELEYEKDEVTVHFDRLYPDVDVAETLSCVTGQWIKGITAEGVEFADGSKQSLSKPDWRLIKPLIYWGPVV
jgi:hypothetical protein